LPEEKYPKLIAAEVRQPESHSQLQISLFIRATFSRTHVPISTGVHFRVLEHAFDSVS
jgi:hypothetical protein